MEKKRLLLIASASHIGIGQSCINSAMMDHIKQNREAVIAPKVFHTDLETGSLSDLVKVELIKSQTKVFELQRTAHVDNRYYNPKFTNRSARRKEEKQQRKNNKRK